MEVNLAYSLVVATLMLSGLVIITRDSSFLRILVGLELVLASSAVSLVLWGGSLGFFILVVVVDTSTVAVAAALALKASRRYCSQSVDELNKLKK